MTGSGRGRGGVGSPAPVEIVAEVVVSSASGPGRMTVLRLTWTERDPLAVTLALSAEPDHPALPRGQWVILRDFLRYGLEHATGDGEVRVRPDDRGDRVWLEMRRANRPCCVSVSSAMVAGFLDRTEQVVPAGEERSEIALDALIERLLQN